MGLIVDNQFHFISDNLFDELTNDHFSLKKYNDLSNDNCSQKNQNEITSITGPLNKQFSLILHDFLNESIDKQKAQLPSLLENVIQP